MGIAMHDSMIEQPPSKETFDLLPTRLRIKAARGGVIPIHDVTLTEAADEIERLQRQVEALSIHAEKWVKRALGGASSEAGLDALAAQYMETLDDEWQDEIYTTEWGFANRSIPKFVEWLKRAAQPPGDGQ
jgi:hypothetical protein